MITEEKCYEIGQKIYWMNFPTDTTSVKRPTFPMRQNRTFRYLIPI